MVEKTGGPAEHEAFRFLTTYLDGVKAGLVEPALLHAAPVECERYARRLLEQPRVHRAQRRADGRHEVHLREDVALDVDAGRHLHQHQI